MTAPLWFAIGAAIVMVAIVVVSFVASLRTPNSPIRMSFFGVRYEGPILGMWALLLVVGGLVLVFTVVRAVG